MKLVLLNNKGQSTLEFMLILPVFLMFVFTFFLFAFRLTFAELTTYATFWGGRTVVVNNPVENAQGAASSVLPGISVDVDDSEHIVVTGHYFLRPLITSSDNKMLNSELSQTAHLSSTLDMVKFASSTECSETDDNPVNEICL